MNQSILQIQGILWPVHISGSMWWFMPFVDFRSKNQIMSTIRNFQQDYSFIFTKFLKKNWEIYRYWYCILCLPKPTHSVSMCLKGNKQLCISGLELVSNHHLIMFLVPTRICQNLYMSNQKNCKVKNQSDIN